MKVRFRSPEKLDPQRDRGIGFDMAPAKRPDVPVWRWYLLVLLVATPFLFVAGHLLKGVLSLKGSGYLMYSRLEVRAPVDGEVEGLDVSEGMSVPPGAALLRLRAVESQQEAAMFDQALDQTLSITSPGAGLIERIFVQPGDYVVANDQILWLRNGSTPMVQAWMDADYLGRLWAGRPAVVHLPDGSRVPAVIQQVKASTESLPEGLMSPSSGLRSKLVIRLSLGRAVQDGQRINRLPVEVALRWQDDFFRWWSQ